jgi:hypothetical protein
MAKHGRYVRRDQDFFVTDSYYDGRAVSGRDELVGVVNGEEYDSKEAPEVCERSPCRLFQSVAAHFTLDKVGDDFGVGIGVEPVTLGYELMFEREIILDNAVMDNDDLPGAIAVRMGVLLGGTTVGRPARVTESIVAVDWMFGEGLFQSSELTSAAA